LGVRAAQGGLDLADLVQPAAQLASLRPSSIPSGPSEYVGPEKYAQQESAIGGLSLFGLVI